MRALHRPSPNERKQPPTSYRVDPRRSLFFSLFIHLLRAQYCWRGRKSSPGSCAPFTEFYCVFFWVLYRVSYRSSVGLIECFELRMACAGEIASIGQRSVALLSSPSSSFVLSLSPSLSFTSLTHSMLRFGARSFTLNRLSVQTGWIWDCCSTGLNWLSLNFTEFYWMLLGFTRLYWLSFNLARLYWVLLGFTGFY